MIKIWQCWLQLKLELKLSIFMFETKEKFFFWVSSSIHESCNRWNCGNLRKNYVTVWTARNFQCEIFWAKNFLRTGRSAPARDDPWEFRFYLTHHPLFIVHGGGVVKILRRDNNYPSAAANEGNYNCLAALHASTLTPTSLTFCSNFKVFHKIRVAMWL